MGQINFTTGVPPQTQVWLGNLCFFNQKTCPALAGYFFPAEKNNLEQRVCPSYEAQYKYIYRLVNIYMYGYVTMGVKV